MSQVQREYVKIVAPIILFQSVGYANIFVQVGHFAKDCPNVADRGPRTCRNCG
jgi:hypothetical protein